MPRIPGRHLDLYLVPAEGGSLPPAPKILAFFEGHGWTEGRRSGPSADQLVPGGFASVRIDDPGRERIYANGQGGYRVRCPVQADNVVPAFHKALAAWRLGGPRRLDCPACDQPHDLDELDYAPPVAFGSGAVVLVDVSSAVPRVSALSALEPLLGRVVVVGSRR